MMNSRLTGIEYPLVCLAEVEAKCNLSFVSAAFECSLDKEVKLYKDFVICIKSLSPKLFFHSKTEK